MATAAFLCLDQTPWCLTAAYPRKRLSLDVTEQKGMIEYYAFPVSCLFACVHFLSRQEQGTALLCRLLAVMTIMFNHLTVAVKIEGVNPSLSRVASHVGEVYMPVLMSCFRRFAESSEDKNSQNPLSFLLSTIHGMSTFQAAQLMIQGVTAANPVSTPHERNPNCGSSHHDDLFDDLDDSIFACIETGEAIETFPAVDTEPYWKSMLLVLAMLKVCPDGCRASTRIRCLTNPLAL